MKLTKLIHDTDLRGALGLYIYRPDGYHTGAKWFCRKPQDAHEINIDQVRELVRQAMDRKVEVRITNGGDNLVFHSLAGKVLYPLNGFDAFWARVEQEQEPQQ